MAERANDAQRHDGQTAFNDLHAEASARGLEKGRKRCYPSTRTREAKALGVQIGNSGSGPYDANIAKAQKAEEIVPQEIKNREAKIKDADKKV